MRDDLARPRTGFRMREDGSLPTRECECGGLLYVVPAGTWLHWSTLEEACPLIGPSDGQDGAGTVPADLDTGKGGV